MVQLRIRADDEHVQAVRSPGRHLRLADASTPPIASQPVTDGPQAEPFHHLWYSAQSVPVTKTSSRLGPQETTVGGLWQTPPSDSQPVTDGPQAEPFHHLW